MVFLNKKYLYTCHTGRVAELPSPIVCDQPVHIPTCNGNWALTWVTQSGVKDFALASAPYRRIVRSPLANPHLFGREPMTEVSGSHAAERLTVRVLASTDELALNAIHAGDGAWSSRVSELAALAVVDRVAL